MASAMLGITLTCHRTSARFVGDEVTIRSAVLDGSFRGYSCWTGAAPVHDEGRPHSHSSGSTRSQHDLVSIRRRVRRSLDAALLRLERTVDAGSLHALL